MYLSGDADSYSFAIGSILVVGVAVLGSLTVLPAVLVKLGDRVHQSRVPLLSRLGRDKGDSRVWGWILGHVLRRPVVSLVVAGGVLLALAAPALHMKTTVDRRRRPLPQRLPGHEDVRQAHRRVPRPRPTASRSSIKATDVTSPGDAGRDRRARPRGRGQPRTSPARSTVRVNDDDTVAGVAVPLVGNGTDDESMDALATVRERPRARHGRCDVAGATVDVNGGPADDEGLQRQPGERTRRWSSPSSSAMAFMLLLMTFRSIVIPIKALLLNLLSVAAAYGVLTLLFQDGWGELIGLEQTDGIVAWLPMFLFVLLFGLSHGLPRVHPQPHQGAAGTAAPRNDEAVEQGIKQLGRRRDRRGHGDGRGVRDLRHASP